MLMDDAVTGTVATVTGGGERPRAVATLTTSAHRRTACVANRMYARVARRVCFRRVCSRGGMLTPRATKKAAASSHVGSCGGKATQRHRDRVRAHDQTRLENGWVQFDGLRFLCDIRERAAAGRASAPRSGSRSKPKRLRRQPLPPALAHLEAAAVGVHVLGQWHAADPAAALGEEARRGAFWTSGVVTTPARVSPAAADPGCQKLHR